MTRLGYYNKDKRLEEGKFYTFRYVKLVELEDLKQYMVFEDYFGVRHFIEYECYKAYDLKEQTDVVCLVDKINCTGRIFLEPLHPVYKTGDLVDFEVFQCLNTEEGFVLYVHDCFQNIISVNVNGFSLKNPKEIKRIVTKVKSVKKGIPELLLVSVTESDNDLTTIN